VIYKPRVPLQSLNMTKAEQPSAACPVSPSHSYCQFSDIRSKPAPDTPPSPSPKSPSPLTDSGTEMAREFSSFPQHELYAQQTAEPYCPGCIVNCEKSQCSAVEMTSQCTDKCVVITCSDETHDGMACPGQDSHCNYACDSDAMDCSECQEMEEFVSRRMIPARVRFL
jgi:hypothetical protein